MLRQWSSLHVTTVLGLLPERQRWSWQVRPPRRPHELLETYWALGLVQALGRANAQWEVTCLEGYRLVGS